MPAITWQDGNAAPEAERLAGLTRTLGNQRCNLPFPGSRMAILRQLKDHAPEEYRNIGYALGCVSFLVYCLTGQSVTDLSNCGEGVDLAKGSYAADIYQAFGLADMLDKLPSLRPSWAVAGPVSPRRLPCSACRRGCRGGGGPGYHRRRLWRRGAMGRFHHCRHHPGGKPFA